MEKILRWFFRIVSILFATIAIIALGAALISAFKEQGILGVLFNTVLFVVKLFLVVGLSVGINWAWEQK